MSIKIGLFRSSEMSCSVDIYQEIYDMSGRGLVVGFDGDKSLAEMKSMRDVLDRAIGAVELQRRSSRPARLGEGEP